VSATSPKPSARRAELLEAAYDYALTHGLADLSLRPLASAIGTSPRVLLFLFDSKDGLLEALLARARSDELAVLAQLSADPAHSPDLEASTRSIWAWLRDPAHRPLLRLWAEAYTRSLVEPNGPWAGFAAATVNDWLRLLAQTQPADEHDDDIGQARRTLALAVLRGCLLDLLATDDQERVDEAIDQHLKLLNR
jgi:AcrR family transcriptional regulator